MFKKIIWLNNFFKLLFKRGVKLRGFVKIDSGVEFILEKNSRLILGKNVQIRKNSVLAVYPGAVLELEDNVFLAHGVTLAAKKSLRIGANSLLAEYVSIRDHDHNYQTGKNWSASGDVIKPVELGQNVWLGAKVTVVKGVKIGRQTVLGANSVVTGNIPAQVVAAGVPAKIIKRKK